MKPAGPHRDTVAAVATAAGRAAIGIVRITGPEAHAVLSAVVPSLGPDCAPRRAYAAWAVDPETGERIDRVLALRFDEGASYTGECSAEIQAHGGATNMQRLLSAVMAAGASPAPAGEFTRRAFMSGRMDLVQAEAVALMVSACSARAARASASQLAGGLSRAIEKARGPLVRALVSLEASLDFPDDDVGDPDQARIRSHLEDSLERVEALLGTWHRSQKIFGGLRVVLAGPPNAGKSSLMNRILGTERALTDARPGTTRDYLEQATEVDGVQVVLVDTAGVREGGRRVETLGIQMSLREVRSADVVLLVVDSAGITPEALESLVSEAPDGSVVVAVNKVDLDQRMDDDSSQRIRPFSSHRVSALTGEGVEEMISRVVAGHVQDSEAREVLLSCERHRHLLERSRGELAGVLAALDDGIPLDVLASCIRQAVAPLDELTGRQVLDQVLDEIFSTFCIGK